MDKYKQFFMAFFKWTGVALGIATVVGIVGALILKWPIVQGIYVMCLVLAVFAMLYASVMFIGTPQMRYDYLVRGKQLRRQGRGKEVDGMENQGILPAVIAVVLVIIGFALEASLH